LDGFPTTLSILFGSPPASAPASASQLDHGLGRPVASRLHRGCGFESCGPGHHSRCASHCLLGGACCCHAGPGSWPSFWQGPRSGSLPAMQLVALLDVVDLLKHWSPLSEVAGWRNAAASDALQASVPVTGTLEQTAMR